jgi:hypothetical protein
MTLIFFLKWKKAYLKQALQRFGELFKLLTLENLKTHETAGELSL